jgi:hypothetical protein
MARKKVDPSQKNVWIVLALFVLILLAMIIVGKKKIAKISPTPTPQTQQRIPFDFGNKTVILDGQNISFSNSQYQNSDPTNGQHSASVANQNVNPAENRAAAIVVDSPGGSGTFYYLIGAMLQNEKEVYSQPVSLGDRITIQSLTVDNPEAEDNGIITVEYFDRRPNAPMSAEPNVKKIANYAFQDDGNLIEVLK